MKRFAQIAVPAAALLIAGAAWAGGKDCEKAAQANNVAHAKCTASAEECRKMMAESKSRGWIGLDLDKSEEGVLTVTKVFAGSPAEKAGFQSGDVLVSMNGVTLGEDNYDKLKAVKKNLHIGDTVTYKVKRAGGEQSISAKLSPMPDEVYTAMVTEHMQEHETIASR